VVLAYSESAKFTIVLRQQKRQRESGLQRVIEQEIQLTLDLIRQYQSISKKVMILDPSLSMYSPFLKISNSTRYDFPTKGNFGHNHGADAIDYINSNSNICLFVSNNTVKEVFYPLEIVNAVQPTMKTKTTMGKWTIYCQ